MQEDSRRRWWRGCLPRPTTQTKNPQDESRGFRKWRLPTLPRYSAVQYHRRCCLSLCPCLSLLPSPLSAPLSPASARSALSPAPAPSPARRRRAQPTPRMAHTAARPAPLMHFSQPNDHPSLMGIAKECVNARPWGPQNISNFWGERRHELLLRFSGVVSSSQSRCRPRHLWSL